MSFLHPEFFYYILPPFLFLFFLLLTQKEAAMSFFSDEVIDRLRVATKGLTLKARNALFFLAGFFMIVALAEPVIPNGETVIEQKSADILIALDISNSMRAKDLYPSRLEFSKQKAIDFIRLLHQNRVGVVAFAKGSYLVSPLSFDREAVAFLLQNLDTSSITEQGTDFMALLESVKDASKKSKQKYLLLFTDGGDKKDFSKEIGYAKENGITVFIIGVGTKKGAPIPMPNGEFLHYRGDIVVTKFNESVVDLALKTGGVFIQATNSNRDIEAMRKEIERVIKKKTLRTKSIKKYIPLFYIPLGLAMLLVLLALSSMTKRKVMEVPGVFLLAVFLFFQSQARAGVLDFIDIKEAKEAYNSKAYADAAKKFEEYAKSSKKPQAYYDAANGYYKAKKYKKAIELYKKVQTNDADLMAHTFHNLGNAYAQAGEYEKAVEAYKDALKLRKDKETKENLKKAKKLLKKQKQQQQNNKNKNSKNKKSKQNSKNEKQQSKSDKNQNGKKNDSKTSKNKQNTKQNKEQKKQGEKQQNKKKEKQKQKLQQLDNNETKKQDNNESARLKPKIYHNEKKMSNAEERKWLKELNKDAKTFMYRIKPAQNSREDEDEKPW